MKQQKITYEDLQFHAKIAPDTIARCCDGRIASCKLETLEKIARALRVDVKDLFSFQAHENSPQRHKIPEHGNR